MTGTEQPIIAVSGVKNSGKTTLVEKLVAALVARGLRVAVIKHDGHHFEPDVPGTDSYRHRAAGAYGTAIYDGEKFMLVKTAQVSPRDLFAQFPEADLILLEGAKDSPWPKFEIVRAGNSEHPVCDPATLLALVTDLPLTLDGVPTLGLEDIDAMVRLILSRLQP
jgi:molybdopterin-guanine dinucleotide biosynthesis protein B